MRVQVERLKNMSLRRSFFLLTLCGLLAALILTALLWKGCKAVSSQYPSGGVMIDSNGVIQSLPAPTPEQMRMRAAVDLIFLLGCILFPAAGLAAAGMLFYRWKLKEPLSLLLEGTQLLFVGDEDTIRQAFGIKGEENYAFLPKIMSRKKQVIPMLSALWG